MNSSRAFAPGNVSCIFRIVRNRDPAKMHSLGLGFTVNEGILVEVRLSNKNCIFFNNKKIRIPTISSIIKKLNLKKIKINIKSELPLGSGFGLSGACALGTAYALNDLLELKKTKKELAMIAHIAEVENRTGLGDVGGQFNGGFNMKSKRGKPLAVEKLPIKNKIVYYKFFSKISTKDIITNKNKEENINRAADLALKKIKSMKNISFEKIIKISKEFSVKSGLLKNKKVKNIIKDIEEKGGNASMIMLGNAVFSDIPFKGCKQIRMSNKGAYVL